MSDHLELLWDQYSHRLGAFIRSRVRDDVEAEDILQEVFKCCHFEFDRRGRIVDYYDHCCCCNPTRENLA